MLKKELNVSIIASIVYIILGVVVVCNPAATLDVVGKTIAILSIIHGIAIAFISIQDIREDNNLVFGIISIVMGVLLLVYPSSLALFISLGIGIWYIVNSVTRIRLAIMLKDVKEVNWVLLLICSILTLIIGISFLFTPLASAIALTAVSGIMMIAYSIIDIAQIIFLKKHINEIEKAMAK